MKLEGVQVDCLAYRLTDRGRTSAPALHQSFRDPAKGWPSILPAVDADADAGMRFGDGDDTAEEVDDSGDDGDNNLRLTGLTMQGSRIDGDRDPVVPFL